MGRKTLVLVASLALLLTACGGSGDTSETEPTPATSKESTTTAAVPASEGSGGEESPSGTEDLVGDAQEQLEGIFDTAGGTATVSIGGETWEFGLFEGMPASVCDSDFYGGFIATLTSGDDYMVPFNGLSVMLPGGDFQDPPNVTVSIAVDGDVEWIADETVYEQYPTFPEGLGVTEFSIDGQTASGAGVFYEKESGYQFNAGLADELMTAQGTFEVTCAPE